MAERLALVIASECEEFPRLGFTGELATALYSVFTTVGQWLPIGDGPVLDPTIIELKRRIKAAFQRADELGATLLIAFIGHGFTTNNDDFYLLAADSAMPLDSDSGCHLVPRHLSFNGTQVRRGDQGLWLVPNRSRSRDAVTGRPAAGLVDHLVRSVSLTSSVQETLTDIVEASSDRLQALIGPAGAGKSTLMSLLIRPVLVETLGSLTAEFVTAAVFLDVTSTIESVLMELRSQLGARFGAEFAAVQQAVQADYTRAHLAWGAGPHACREWTHTPSRRVRMTGGCHRRPGQRAGPAVSFERVMQVFEVVAVGGGDLIEIDQMSAGMTIGCAWRVEERPVHAVAIGSASMTRG
ncbi:hypothetical protein [Nocardia anaemiae]|uniref:hypothetical protein n=1 Tax=Nocardia anaemiae TaxID=263910 RepID=UPI0007A534C4|nr:hypothetical protein [Nocardia anaemiae]